jgi:hypothetical protein
VAALDVDVTRDWLDYLIAFGPLIAVVAAFGVAWLPHVMERRRRPIVRLQWDASLPRSSFAGPGIAFNQPKLEIEAAAGHDGARDVEVFASFAFGGHESLVPDPMQLPFGSPLALVEPPSRVSIAPGFRRRVWPMVLGHPVAISQQHWETTGRRETLEPMKHPALFTTTAESSSHWLNAGETYDLRLWVTGANFDAIEYTAQFRITAEQLDDFRPGTPVVRLLFEWLKEPARAKRSDRAAAGERTANDLISFGHSS